MKKTLGLVQWAVNLIMWSTAGLLLFIILMTRLLE
jgi:hypothetical protein